MRGAVVLFEGLPPTVIDSQVFAHVRLVREVLGIDLAVVAVACTRALFESSQLRLPRAREAAGGDVRLIRGIRPALPGSLAVNRVLLGRELGALGPLAFLHARADYAAAVTGPWAQRRGVPMLWDCRGDSRAELRERLGKRMPAMLRYRLSLLDHEFRVAGKTCAGALFVTSHLREAMAAYLKGQPGWIIPCLAPEAEFFFDPVLRTQIRNKLSIAPDEMVYVYSGSLAAYQCFDETVAIFRTALNAGEKARLIVLTPEVDRARMICEDLPPSSLICTSVPHAEVNGYLNAADFGMLLRDSTPVNVVAFPTKFAEYAMTGLRVLLKEAPPACIEVAQDLGNYLPPGGRASPWTSAERGRCAGQAARRLGRRSAMPTYADVYKSLAMFRS
jgi:hypothetical protein